MRESPLMSTFVGSTTLRAAAFLALASCLLASSVARADCLTEQSACKARCLGTSLGNIIVARRTQTLLDPTSYARCVAACESENTACVQAETERTATADANPASSGKSLHDMQDNSEIRSNRAEVLKARLAAANIVNAHNRERTFRSDIRTASGLMRAGAYGKAERTLHESLAIHPDDPEANALMIKLMVKRREYARARNGVSSRLSSLLGPHPGDSGTSAYAAFICRLEHEHVCERSEADYMRTLFQPDERHREMTISRFVSLHPGSIFRVFLMKVEPVLPAIVVQISDDRLCREKLSVIRSSSGSYSRAGMDALRWIHVHCSSNPETEVLAQKMIFGSSSRKVSASTVNAFQDAMSTPRK